MKILFLARALNVGGAERQLVALALGLRKRGHEVAVSVFYPGGMLETELKEAGIPVLSLAKRGRWDVAGFVVRLIKTVRQYRPDLLHTYICNLATVAVQPFMPSMKIVWGVRSSYVDFSRFDWVFHASHKLTCLLSHTADLIIANSQAGRLSHVAAGYPAHKMVVIPNGIDTRKFVPNPLARERVRAEWGVTENEDLIGLVGRIDPMKDHETFLEAAFALSQSRQRVRFVCVGDGRSDYRAMLQSRACTMGLGDRILWAGSRTDVGDVYSALDVLVNCSSGEGFSNVIGEAMACGVPCVATDVGDSRLVIGPLGELILPKDPSALTKGIQQLLDHRMASAEIRKRIVDRFSLEDLILRTERELLDLFLRPRKNAL